MPFFEYRGRNGRGEAVLGVLEGIDSGAVADQLFNIGVTPVEIRLSRRADARRNVEGWFARLQEGKVGVSDVMLFSRQMYTMLKAGVPILRALLGLQESARSKAFAKMLADVKESLDTGRELSAALRRHPNVFTPLYVSMVRVGEVSGMLEDVFLRLFFYLEFEKTMREKIKAALRYPAFVIAAIAAAVAIINIFVIPAFSKVYASAKAELPLMTRVLIATSDFTVKYWYVILIALGGSFLAFKLYTGTVNGRYRWDRLKLKLPLAGDIICKATLARFARSFSLASRSGMPIVQGLSVVSQVVDNAYIASRIEQMRNGVERGESILRTATAAGVFTPVVLQMIAVGEETGEIDDLMQEVAEMYEREVDYEVRALSDKIEPILIVALGGLVLVLGLGVFLPIWDLGNAMLHKRG